MISSSSELDFKNLYESVWTSLQTFNALCAIPSSGVVSSPLCLTLDELVNVAICDLFNFPEKPIPDLWKFRLAFITTSFGHPLFQELALAAHIAVDKFFEEYKNLKVLLRPSYLLA